MISPKHRLAKLEAERLRRDAVRVRRLAPNAFAEHIASLEARGAMDQAYLALDAASDAQLRAVVAAGYPDADTTDRPQ